MTYQRDFQIKLNKQNQVLHEKFKKKLDSKDKILRFTREEAIKQKIEVIHLLKSGKSMEDLIKKCERFRK
jgi:hypothetical protein